MMLTEENDNWNQKWEISGKREGVRSNKVKILVLKNALSKIKIHQMTLIAEWK